MGCEAARKAGRPCMVEKVQAVVVRPVQVE